MERLRFRPLALAVVLSLFASYVVALTVVPLFCAKFIRAPAKNGGHPQNFNARFRRLFDRLLAVYSRWLGKASRSSGW